MAHGLHLSDAMDLRLRNRMDELKREWDAARRLHPRIVLGAAVSVLLVAVLLAAAGVWTLAGLRDGLPDRDAMSRIGEMDQATAVFDDNDKLAFTIFKEQRIEVPLSEVSPNLTKAITSIEDQRFFDHHGFDLVRIASAALSNVRHNRRAQGGSTITQQLARQSFLTPNKSYRRKVQELILAARLERLYTKQQILELYFNKIYFGDGLYGVEAASRGYFGKHASEVTVAEAALLAGLVKSPSSYAPTVSMERAMSRRNTVLQAMLDNGAIDRPTYQSARASKAALHDTLREEEPHGLYFKEQVRQELVDPVRLAAGLSGRAARLLDDRHADADRRRDGDRGSGQGDRNAPCGLAGPARRRAAEGRQGASRGTFRRAAGRAGRARTEHRPRPGDGRRTRFRRQPLQPRGAGPPAGRLVVQAVRLRRGARSGIHAGDRPRSPRRADRDRAGRMDT